jgi:hypothetical protein
MPGEVSPRATGAPPVTLRPAMAQREERSGTSAAAAAAEQVRAIVETAERSAESLEAAAREEAARIRAEAEADASATREAAARLVEGADELERRLDELTEGIRAAVSRLKEDLAVLRGEGTEAAVSELAAVDTPHASVPAEAGAEVDPTIAETEEVASREPDVTDEPASAAEREPAGTTPEGARVLALKMALDGTPRDKTARYLRENFELDDPDALLDEVYARAGG